MGTLGGAEGGSPLGEGGAAGDATGGGTGGGGAEATGVLARPAASFLASIGVCTHIGQGIDDPIESAGAMSYAGIRNLRDDGRPEHVEDWITVHALSGVRTALLTNHDVASTIDMARALQAAGALLAVEGPNEPNNFPVTYQGQTSDYETTFLPVAYLQRDLYSAVKAEPDLAGVPVFHSSEAGGAEPDNVGLQFLTIPAGAGALMPQGTQYADYANTHNYVCGHSQVLVDNVAWSASDPTLNGDWDGLYVEYGRTWHGGFQGYTASELEVLPRVTTETGWKTEGEGAISEEQQARVFLDLYLAAYERGWAFTFVYMLRDDPGQGYWGLFRTDFSPKVSATYLHNLTTILADDVAGTPGRLDYTIREQPDTVHDLLLQKGDGTFELVVWGERMTGGTDAVEVELGRTFPMAALYDPTTGISPVETLTNVSAVPLTLDDHPLVIELVP